MVRKVINNLIFILFNNRFLISILNKSRNLKNAQNNNNNNYSNQINLKENEIKNHLEAINDLKTRLTTLNDEYNNFKIQSVY